MNIFNLDDLSLINGNCLDRSLVSEGIVDLIVTSPPYNVGIDYNGTNDLLSFDNFDNFHRSWLSNCYEWGSSNCRLCLNVPLDINKFSGSLNNRMPSMAYFINLCMSIGWTYKSCIIWDKGHTSKPTAWGSWLSCSAPSVVSNLECIIVMHKGDWVRDKVNRVSDMTKEEFMLFVSSMWRFNPETSRSLGHPAPFPKELPYRCIKLFSFGGDLVLDPFSGSGTTLVVAKNLCRRSIGIEKDIDYYKSSILRINSECSTLF